MNAPQSPHKTKGVPEHPTGAHEPPTASTGRYKRTYRWSLTFTIATAATTFTAAFIWAAATANWTHPITLAGATILTAPTYGAILWLTWNRTTLLHRVDEALDTADRALDAIDNLRETLHNQRRSVEEPQLPQALNAQVSLEERNPDTAPIQLPDHTEPHALDLAGGARTTSGSTASKDVDLTRFTFRPGHKHGETA